MPDNDIRAQALDRLAQVKRALDNAKAAFTAVTWDLLPEDRREPYRAAMQPFVEALTDLLTAPPHVIETSEELDALPEDTLLLDSWRTVWQRWRSRWYQLTVSRPDAPDRIALPGRVLWTPEEGDRA